MLKYILRVLFFCCMLSTSFFVCGQQIYSEDSLEFEYTALQLEVENLRGEIVNLKGSIDVLKRRNNELHLMNDTLTVVNNEINKQLSEKNALLEEKIRILQQKEILFAEKEQLYKEAISNSNVDKAKVEGLVEALEQVNLDAVCREDVGDGLGEIARIVAHVMSYDNADLWLS